MSKRKAGGYVDRQHLAAIRRTNAAIVALVKRMATDQINPPNPRQLSILSSIALMLAEQANAISEMDTIERS